MQVARWRGRGEALSGGESEEKRCEPVRQNDMHVRTSATGLRRGDPYEKCYNMEIIRRRYREETHSGGNLKEIVGEVGRNDASG